MRRFAWILLVACATLAFGQDVKESDVSPATRRYHEYRQQDTEPPFALAKVKAIVDAIKPGKEGADGMPSLASSAWSRMTTTERFTYCMLHGEDASQNCEGMPWVVDEDKKVFAFPPPFKNAEENWSDRQRTFLKSHRREVVRLLRTTIGERGRVGVNLKAAITEIGAYELIPDLIRAYDRDHKDQDILTVLALLMKDGKYKPFLASVTYHKFYGSDANYQSFIVANEANQKLMKDRATAYYRGRMG